MTTPASAHRRETSYHHGELREALITEGRRLLIEQGPDAVILRELARRTGVSHGAPARHFADREALLAAIRARGFEELTDAVRDAAQASDLHERLTCYARTYVHFAVDNGPLLALMFAAKPRADGLEAEAARRFFALGAELLGEDATGSPGPKTYLVAATLEGIGLLVMAGRLPADMTDGVIQLAVATLVPQLASDAPEAASLPRRRGGG